MTSIINKTRKCLIDCVTLNELSILILLFISSLEMHYLSKHSIPLSNINTPISSTINDITTHYQKYPNMSWSQNTITHENQIKLQNDATSVHTIFNGDLICYSRSEPRTSSALEVDRRKSNRTRMLKESECAFIKYLEFCYSMRSIYFF